ncbi:hypothetical protein DV735_g5585, partial [Chaetothyriales sp. CBS 134920]
MTPSIPDSSARNRSSSGDDTGLPEHDRKRPRLSEGKSDAEDNLPQDGKTAALDTASKPGLPPRTVDVTMTAPSPTSKVTINTRPLSSQSLNRIASAGGDGAVDSKPAQTAATLSPIPKLGAGPKEVISIPSSPEPSPDVEIAKAEEFDHDSAQTKSTRTIDANASSVAAPWLKPFYVYRTFPFAGQFKRGEARGAVETVSRAMQDGSVDISDCFDAVKNWLVDFAARFHELTAEIVEEDPGFWAKGHLLLSSLLRRENKLYFPLPVDQILRYSNAFADITKLLLQYETRRLQQLVDESPKSPAEFSLMTWAWLNSISMIVAGRSLLFESLRASLGIDPIVIRQPFIDHVLSPSGLDLMSAVLDLITTIGNALPKYPKLHKELTIFFPFLEHMSNLYAITVGPTEPGQPFPQATEIQSGTEKILRKLDDVLQVAIKRQQAWLNLDNAMEIVDQLNKCMKTVSTSAPHLAKEIITSANIEYEDDDLANLHHTMLYAWKFTMLNRFIKHGRMELRVAGVEQMSRDLVQVYFQYIQNDSDGHEDPLVKFLVRFLRANNMTSYIVSVDSHPTLAERAANLVGFLNVAKQYTNEDTDSIWQVVEFGQDPRMITAALHLLSGCFVTFNHPDFYYMCQKILELPFSKFDDGVLQFTLQILQNIRQKGGQFPLVYEPSFDPITRRLCLHLLREANTPAHCTTEFANNIRREVLSLFTYFTHPARTYTDRLGISEDEQEELILQIRTDIESHGAYASGAILALHEILNLQGLSTSTLSQIVEQSGCPGILVDNIAALSAQAKAAPSSADCLNIQLECRLRCLFVLLRVVPDKFDGDLLESTWSSLLTAAHLPSAIKVVAWEQLTHLMLRSKSPNSAIASLLHGFWDRLRPQDFNKATLDFAKQSVMYESALLGAANAPSSDNVVSIPGMERVWRVMLECLPGTVEMEATDFIIAQYLRSAVITRRPRAEIHATHLSLIDRSVSQVISSAERLKTFSEPSSGNGDDDSMVIIASEAEISLELLKFDRSLLFLKCFTNALKKDPTASPVSSRHSEDLPEFEGKKGEPQELWLKVQGNRYVSDSIRRLSIGSENTGLELGEYISNATGWSQFIAVNCGRRLNLHEDNSTLSELNLFNGKPLMIGKISTTEERQPRAYRSGSPVDSKIMHHFDDLYALLDAEDRLAKEVYDYLRTTSVRQKITEPIKAKSTPAEDLLSSQKPYKLLFCTGALRACVEFEHYSQDSDSDFLFYAVDALTHALIRLGANSFNTPLELLIGFEILETLSMALRTKVPQEVSLAYFPRPKEYVDQIANFLFGVQHATQFETPTKGPEAMAKTALEVLFESCLHDDSIWQHVHQHETLSSILQRCVLVDDRPAVRATILDVVQNINGSASAKAMFKMNNPHAPRSRFDSSSIESCLTHIWKLLLPILELAATYPESCQDVCDASLVILKVIGKSLADEDVLDLFNRWSSSLVQHSYYEIVGQPLRDRFISGMARLLCECAHVLRGRKALPSQRQYMHDLVSAFMFPPLSDFQLDLTVSRHPVLDSKTRQSLYDLLLMLCQASDEIDILVSEMSDDFVEQDYFAPYLSHDRLALRSEVGYAGLRNLSNTCYLNSLLSQLFMHVQFRHLLINTPIIDRERQKLFAELGKVFSYMQSSHEKSIDPQGAVDSIVTYEGGEIDVTVQMDVDEFFNLLFDRLEGQMLDENAKSCFKSLYGGETIQQIKSKECEHVSERPESFAVLPVEIKGKSRLEDSLKAYVEGEVLQGDNKYSCTSCGRHVDAVKRNCLKRVPDNLIFNLKRFDFDIMTGTRCKLNDQFQFPDELDMAPYKLEYLSHPDEPVEPDIFELTGIIVHSGTADSGHYFSYIRQRPSGRDKAHSWVQFNDSDVTQFDPAHIQDNCFGGIDATYGMQKFYNAYMLFYQRKSDIRQTEEQFCHVDPLNPVRLTAPASLERHIAQQNELFLRAYCVQDENHARFLRELIARLWDCTPEGCSTDHAVENKALQTALEYVQQISSRWKGQPEMEETVNILLKFISRCVSCASTVCVWLISSDSVQDSMVRSPMLPTRKAFCSLLKTSLEVLHGKAEEDVEFAVSYKATLEACLHLLAAVWDHTFRYPRSWTDYFGLLNDILLLGEAEAEAMLKTDFMEYCLEIIRLHTLESSETRPERRGRGRYSVYVSGRERNRAYNHAALINFFTELFLHVNLRSRTNLRRKDAELLGIDRMPYALDWLRRIINGKQSPGAANALVQRLAQDIDLAGAVCQLLATGAESTNMNVAVAYLDPIVAFCQNGVHENQIVDLAAAVLEGIQTIDISYGSAYLQFVKNLLEIKNEVAELDAGFLGEKVLAYLPQWASVLVIAPNENQHDVRNDTFALLQELLLDPLEKTQGEDPAKYRSLSHIAIQLVAKALHIAKSTFMGRAKESSTMQLGQIEQLVVLEEKIFDLVEPGAYFSEQEQGEIKNTLGMLRMKSEHAVEALSPDNWQGSSDLEVSRMKGSLHEDDSDELDGSKAEDRKLKTEAQDRKLKPEAQDRKLKTEAQDRKLKGDDDCLDYTYNG